MRILIALAMTALSLGALHPSHAAQPADLVVTDAKIYTVDANRSIAQAMAVRAGKIVFVGSAAQARGFTGFRARTMGSRTCR